MRGKRKCQDTDWVVVMLERTGRRGLYGFQQRPREVRVEFGRKKSLGSKMCKEISWERRRESLEHAESVWCTQTLYFLFPVSPRKLLHFPLLYSWQTEGSQVFFSKACLFAPVRVLLISQKFLFTKLVPFWHLESSNLSTPTSHYFERRI